MPPRTRLELHDGRCAGTLAYGSELLAEEPARLSIGRDVLVRLFPSCRIRPTSPDTLALQDGEAHFSVCPGTPFHVLTPRGTVKVRGTDFIVRVTSEGPPMKTAAAAGVLVAVTSGAVLFLHAGGETPVESGEVLRARSSGEIEVSRLEQETAGLEAALLREETLLAEARERKRVQFAQEVLAAHAAGEIDPQKKFDLLAERLELDPQMRETIRMFLLKPDTMRPLLALQAAREAAAILKALPDDLPLTLEQKKALVKRVSGKVGQINALEVDLADRTVFLQVIDNAPEEIVRTLRDRVGRQQQESVNRLMDDIEADYGPAARKAVWTAFQEQAGFHAELVRSLAGTDDRLAAGLEWARDSHPYYPFGTFTRRMLPTEIDELQDRLSDSILPRIEQETERAEYREYFEQVFSGYRKDAAWLLKAAEAAREFYR